MGFEEWDDEDWKVTEWMNNQFALKAPGTRYIFNKHDLLQLYHNISLIAENIFEKEEWFVHDGTIINRETGEQLIGVTEDCYKLNELSEENKQLKQFKKEVFDVIDKNIKEDEHFYKMSYEDYLNGRIEALKELKEELE